MHEGAPERVVKLVLMGRILDLATVLERDRLAAFDVKIDRVHMDAGREGRVA